MQDKLEKAKVEIKSLQEDKNANSEIIKQWKEKAESVKNDSSKIQERCEELVNESKSMKEENIRVLDELAIAKKESKRFLESSGSSNDTHKKRSKFSDSKFTREDLETTIETLMKRLSCPVCDFGQKECIITTCRHMFCKKCIDKNIKVRLNLTIDVCSMFIKSSHLNFSIIYFLNGE